MLEASSVPARRDRAPSCIVKREPSVGATHQLDSLNRLSATFGWCHPPGDLHLGSVRDIVDDNERLRQHKTYDSFGNILEDFDYEADGTLIPEVNINWDETQTILRLVTGQDGNLEYQEFIQHLVDGQWEDIPAGALESREAIDTIFGYTARPMDEETGLQNNLNRWYDSTTGRWLSKDPIGFNAGDPNLYRYVGNGPTNATDPSGLAPPRLPGGPIAPNGVDTRRMPPSPYVLPVLPLPRFRYQSMPTLNTQGVSGGTPKEPTGIGDAINIFGSEENLKYKDYATDKQYDQYFVRDKESGKRVERKRAYTSDLASHTVSDICIRNSPIYPVTWREIVRLAIPGTVVTIATTQRHALQIYNDIQDGNLIEGWHQISHPISFKFSDQNSGFPVPVHMLPEDLRPVMFTVQLKGNCKYIGPSDDSQPASVPPERQ